MGACERDWMLGGPIEEERAEGEMGECRGL